jgi:hypothetical protein
MSQIAGNCLYISQQDCAPAHNSKWTQDWNKQSLTEMCQKEIWPPSSPDCNRLDCITSSVSELRVNLKPQTKTENLLSKIKEVMESFHRSTMGNRHAGGLGQDQRLSSMLYVPLIFCFYFIKIQ